jgi:hypothetical protein
MSLLMIDQEDKYCPFCHYCKQGDEGYYEHNSPNCPRCKRASQEWLRKVSRACSKCKSRTTDYVMGHDYRAQAEYLCPSCATPDIPQKNTSSPNGCLPVVIVFLVLTISIAILQLVKVCG